MRGNDHRHYLGQFGRSLRFLRVPGCALGFSLALVLRPGICDALGAEPPPLVFLGDKDYPPVAYLENGIAKGMDVDLAKALAAPMKREVRVELMDWNLAQEKVLKGEGDKQHSL